jgi:hypothetical protein
MTWSARRAFSSDDSCARKRSEICASESGGRPCRGFPFLQAAGLKGRGGENRDDRVEQVLQPAS